MKQFSGGPGWRAVAVLGLLVLGNAQAQTTVKLATLTPLSGSLESLGGDIRRGAALAVKLRTDELRKAGLNVVLQSFDDRGDPLEGAANAEKILRDPGILGVIGALNSGVSLKAGEVFARGPLVMISPASTADKLTAQGWKHFFRVVAPDRAQANVAGEYIAKTLQSNGVYLVTDNTTYGNGLTGQVREALRSSKVKVAGSGGTYDENDFDALIGKIRESGADLVFFGGTPDKGGPFLKRMRANGLNATFMGGDALDSDVFTSTAGDAAKGALFTTVYGPVTAFSNELIFSAYYQKEFQQEPSGFAAFGFDAANVMLDALKNAAAKGSPSRQSLLNAVRTAKLSGSTTVTGRISFTPAGERAASPVLLMKLNATSLKPGVERVMQFFAPVK